MSGAFQVGGRLRHAIDIQIMVNALIISADNQNTGEEQSMFSIESRGGAIFATELATFEGNALDIDQWHADNFSFIA